MKLIKIKSEIKKHFGATLIAAFGIIAALAWKDVLEEYMTGVIIFSPMQGKIITAVIVTVISIIAIITITQLTDSKK